MYEKIADGSDSRSAFRIPESFFEQLPAVTAQRAISARARRRRRVGLSWAGGVLAACAAALLLLAPRGEALPAADTPLARLDACLQSMPDDQLEALVLTARLDPTVDPDNF